MSTLRYVVDSANTGRTHLIPPLVAELSLLVLQQFELGAQHRPLLVDVIPPPPPTDRVVQLAVLLLQLGPLRLQVERSASVGLDLHLEPRVHLLHAVELIDDVRRIIQVRSIDPVRAAKSVEGKGRGGQSGALTACCTFPRASSTCFG